MGWAGDCLLAKPSAFHLLPRSQVSWMRLHQTPEAKRHVRYAAMAFRRAVSRMTVTSSPGLSVKPTVSILATSSFLCMSKPMTGVSECMVSEATSEHALQVEHAMELSAYLLM